MLTAAVVRLIVSLRDYCCMIRDADTLIDRHIPHLVWTKLVPIGSRLCKQCPVYRQPSAAVQCNGQRGSASASCNSLRAQTARLALWPPRRRPDQMHARPRCRPGPSSLWSQSWAATSSELVQHKHAGDHHRRPACYVLLALHHTMHAVDGCCAHGCIQRGPG